MNTEQRMHSDTVVAVDGDVFATMFTLDLGDGEVDRDAVERIHGGDFDEWIEAAARSGLFTPQAVAALVQQWQENPKSLFDALLVDADEMTHKRYAIIWDALDDVDTFESVEYA
ncbi:hypothetical protein CJ179_42000 [Rhodococcus sp. ACS1]|jgi:hypothetical protein|uniref:Uncharacterized protein n=1 Tax=Rhodococcus koreensis TaxID=99653 RepID=A0A1H4VQF6_9NOCA|nr:MULTISPECIES: hypothetical protein [Rhodococcus]MDF3306676.1 hypothetical protein [Rhodococcus sp. T2V]PBC36563.1 hypothetical protein CJ179_42000 [Rhodococcus sp. ACS1]QSE81105.1 hypothetical protein JWS14_19150 [Rhodococcus koreensis]SEC83349.1 hypothetical protein SAMN04490239_5639 [Rhodococcus koreensis]